METKSGSYPPCMVPKVHSATHQWLRRNINLVQEDCFDIEFREFQPEEIPELQALQEELFPIQYSEALYNNIGKSIFSLGAFAYHKDYEEGLFPLILGVILFRITENASNEYLRFTYFMTNTHSAYIITIGVVEEMRGKGIAKELISQCKEICLSHVPTPLYLSLHVAEYNNEAIPFYERLNFELSEILDSHYFIEGKYYGARLYIFYFPEAKKPIISWNNISTVASKIFRFPGCFRI
jgi:ribosomal protein S18 acetylase RimI-like enzyme